MTIADEKLNARIMGPLFAVVAIDAIGAGVILPLLPFYSRHFGATPFIIGALVATFSLCQFVAAPWLGKLSDRFGRKPVLIGSQLGTCIALMLLASAQSIGMVFAARILDGLTSGNISVAAAYAVDNSTPRTRKQAIGIVTAAIGVGVMAGPALSALLAQFSMSAPVWGAAALSGASVLATRILLPAQERQPAARELKVAAPKATLRQVVAKRETVAVLAVLTAFYLALSMYISQFALFLSGRFEWHGVPFGPREVGIAFTAAGAVNIFVQLFAMKRLGSIFSENSLALLSLGLLAIGYLGLAFAANLPELAVVILIASFGSALARPTLTTTLTLTAGSGQQGALMGVNTSVMALSNVVGPLLAGLLIGRGWYIGWAITIGMLIGVAMLVIQLLIATKRWPRGTEVLKQA